MRREVLLSIFNDSIGGDALTNWVKVFQLNTLIMPKCMSGVDLQFLVASGLK